MNATVAPCEAARITRRRRYAGVALTTALLAGALTTTAIGGARAAAPTTSSPTMAPVMAPMDPTVLPSSVLLFPAVISGDSGATGAAAMPANQRAAQQIITQGLRSFLDKGKIGVVVYSRRLPSIQRAIQEGTKPEDAAAGPGDDPRKAQRFASILGANEYLTCFIDDYKFDSASRTVTFNLSVSRYAADGTALGTTAIKAIGTSPAEILGAHQESYADEAASQVAAEQAIEGVYPQVAAIINPPKEMAGKKKRGHKAGKFLVPVLAVGAALIGPHT